MTCRKLIILLSLTLVIVSSHAQTPGKKTITGKWMVHGINFDEQLTIDLDSAEATISRVIDIGRRSNPDGEFTSKDSMLVRDKIQ